MGEEECEGTGGANLSETPQVGLVKDEHDEGRDQHAADQDEGAQLPGHLALAGARVDEAHDGDGVEGRQQVKDLEEVVPCAGFMEEVCVARDEDERVEELRQEGDAWRKQ